MMELAHCCRSEGGMLNTRRKDQYIKSGLVKRVGYPIDKKTNYLFQLTARGKEFVKSQFPDTYFYSTGDAIFHDLKLVEAHKTLRPGDRWYTEGQAKQILEDRQSWLRENGRIGEANLIEQRISDGQISAPDGIVWRADREEFEIVEVITRNYSKEDKEAKREWARAANIRDDFEFWQ